MSLGLGTYAYFWRMSEQREHPMTLEDALRSADPSAIADVDCGRAILRVESWLEAGELLVLLRASGLPLDRAQIVQLPSICCGGCGG